MLKNLFQMLFGVAAVSAPVAAFADRPDGAGANGPMMDGAILGHGAFGPVITLLFFTVAVGIVFIAIKLIIGPGNHPGPPPA